MQRQRNLAEPISTIVEKLSHDGRGIARIEGKTTFIEGALAGEEVTFEYTRKKKDFDEGRVIDVLTASPVRATPRCPHYGVCGGCSLQHMNETAQIYMKQDQLLDLLMRVGHVQPQRVLPPLQSDHWHYRHKARLSVRYVEKKQAVLVGFREKKNPRYITAMDQCSILSNRVDPLIHVLSELITTLDAREHIAQIEVAAGDDDLAFIIRHLSPLNTYDEVRLRTFAKETNTRLFLQAAGPDSVRLFYPEDEQSYLIYALPEHGIKFQFHPTDFTQVNIALNRKMVSQALELLALESHDVVLDLFCGLGNFSLPMARLCQRVVGIEGSDGMVNRARMNADKNGLLNTQFQCMNLDDEQVFQTLKSFGANKMLIDPPRAGAEAVMKKIHLLNPEWLVYVSCDPATLARDAGILVHEQGYHLVAAGVMDMFPHTTHVESIALFQREIR